ncbi:MAG: hypothetical protein AAF810_00400 [Cyanobacteria bacterium P01_D01_bin.36]
MSQTLTLEISEQAFIAIKKEAEATGVAPAHLAALMLEQKVTNVSNSAENSSKSAAAKKFESHFGSLSIAQAMNVDNESIDTDLAMEYAGGLE